MKSCRCPTELQEQESHCKRIFYEAAWPSEAVPLVRQLKVTPVILLTRPWTEQEVSDSLTGVTVASKKPSGSLLDAPMKRNGLTIEDNRRRMFSTFSGAYRDSVDTP